MPRTGFLAFTSKAHQFISCEESHWQFLKDVHVLDPAQKLSLPDDVSIYSTIPGLTADEIPSLLAKWDIYNTAVLDLHGEVPFDPLGFCISRKSRTTRLVNIALWYLALPVNSVDTERSFSAYNNVVSDKRYSLTLENTKMLVCLYFYANNGQLF